VLQLPASDFARPVACAVALPRHPDLATGRPRAPPVLALSFA